MKINRLFVSISIFFVACMICPNTSFSQTDWIIPTDDCYIYHRLDTGDGVDNNYNEWRLWIRSDDNTHARESYLKFSLDGTNYTFPEDVKLAFLKITLLRWYNWRENDGLFAGFQVFDVGNNAWTEETLTWNTSPWNKGMAGEPVATFDDILDRIHTDPDPVMPIVINITDYVREQLTIGNTEFSMALTDTAYHTALSRGTDARIFSKECVGDPGAEKNPDSTYIPYLVINENPMWVGYDQIPVKEDCYAERRADTNEGATDSHDTWRIWVRADDDKHARISYLKFDLDDSPYLFDDQVGSAYLCLTIDRLYNYGGLFSTFAVYGVGENVWSEDALTWDNAPWKKEDAGEPIGTFTKQMDQIIGDDPIYPVWFDITDYVKDQLAQGYTTFTLALCDTTYNEVWANLSDIRFFSKDCLLEDGSPSPDAEKDPDITYVPSLYIKGPEETAVEHHVMTVPYSFRLEQNYPNPFNPNTKIHYGLEHSSNVEMVVYDVLGNRVRTLISDRISAGQHSVTWYGEDDKGRTVSAGIYFCRLQSDDMVSTIKMLMVQ